MLEELRGRVGALELDLAAQIRLAAGSDREVRLLRQVNGRLREVVESRDGELARQGFELASQSVELNALRLEVADLRRRLDQSSVNSSSPPSKDRLGQRKSKRRAGGEGSAASKRKRGGQPGHRGSGLSPASADELDGQSEAPPPAACGNCGDDLCEAAEAGRRWAQVWDIPPVELSKREWVLPRRRCGSCRTVTTAQVPGVPWAAPGTVVYGPNVNAACVLLSNYGTVPVERTAEMMAMLLGAPVSTGFVCQANKRLADALATGGYDQAVKAALAAAKVLAADETPVEVIAGNVDDDGQPVPGSPHIFTVGDPDGLMWLTAIGSRSNESILGAGILNSFTGVLVRDDYHGYHQFDAQLDAVQLCCAHLRRTAKEVAGLGPEQAWAEQIATLLAEANTLRDQAIAAGQTTLDADTLSELRATYDDAVADGLATNTDRAWHTGNHPGLRLAKRLRDKADQVLLFSTRFDVPFTSNSAEQALRMGKVRQKISGCWHTLTTLNHWCRIRSYLVNTSGHQISPIHAISAALAGNPWLPALDTS